MNNLSYISAVGWCTSVKTVDVNIIDFTSIIWSKKKPHTSTQEAEAGGTL